MDHICLLENNSMVDLESGETLKEKDDDEEEEVRSMSSTGKKAVKKLGRLRSGTLSPIAGLGRMGDGLNSTEAVFYSTQNLDISIDEFEEDVRRRVENKLLKDKRKQMSSSKKPPKPPRPPIAPSLNAADIKFVTDMSKLAKLKHARAERVKALKNKRAEKAAAASSSTNNIFAIAVSLLFFFVIIFQGLLGSRVQ